jgi:thiamine pyrophosphate-dependent acetolactate synthase large subunit-like protein
MHAWAVRKVFGYPGDGINGVFGALNRARDKIAFLQARYEEMAAFMASAYAPWMRIPMKPARHSNRKPATDSDLKPAGIPI